MNKLTKILIFSAFFLSLAFIAPSDAIAAKSESKAKPKLTESKNITINNPTKQNIEKTSTDINKNSKNETVEIRKAEEPNTIIIQQLDDLSQQIDQLKTQAAFNIDWQVLSAGGGSGSSTNFGLLSVVGQTATGTGSSTNYGISHGFVQNFGSGSCCIGTTGNVDGDAGVDIADLTYLIDYLFINFPELPCFDEGNVDNDSGVDIADLTFLIDYLFINFPDLPDCP